MNDIISLNARRNAKKIRQPLVSALAKRRLLLAEQGFAFMEQRAFKEKSGDKIVIEHWANPDTGETTLMTIKGDSVKRVTQLNVFEWSMMTK